MSILYEKTLLKNILYFVLKKLFQLIFNLKAEGTENLNRPTGLILAGNHSGWLDSLLLIVSCDRPIRFMVGTFVFKAPVIRELVKLAGIIPIKPGSAMEAIELAAEYVKNGDIVCIFPEGCLTLDGKLRRFRKGVAYIHKISKVPVIPFAIHGGFEAWSRRQKLPKPYKITVNFGEPILGFALDNNKLAKELQHRVLSMKNVLSDRESILEDAYSFISYQ